MAAVSSGLHRPGSVTSTRRTGARYEEAARRYLEREGLTFHAANVAMRGGELDLIMRDGDTWVFVEVRYRKSARYGDAAASVDARKQQRLLHSAARWLAEQGGSFATTACRFDVFAITGSQLQWLPNAFTAE